MQRFWSPVRGCLLLAICALACAHGTLSPYSSPDPTAGDDDDVDAADAPAIDSSNALGDDDDDATIASPVVARRARDDDASENVDAAIDDATESGPDGACPAPLAPGDLMIDELMISSVAGTGDYGEWLEVRSNLDCLTNLRGLHGECPRGAKVATFDVGGDVWVPPRGTFVVADSSDPTINHDLPGELVVWFGQPGDVLRNQGTTITLSLSGTLLDTLTYPALTLTVGSSVEFPSDCDPSMRSDFTNWERSTGSFFPGFFGTPNAPNTDVACPSLLADW